VAGDYFTDTIVVGNMIIPPNATDIGLATKTKNGPVVPNDGHGLVGVGYRILESEVQNQIVSPAAAPPTLYQAMAKAGAINRQAFSIYLDDQQSGKGSVIFGGVDSTKYTGELVALPVILNGTIYADYSVALTESSLTTRKAHIPLPITTLPSRLYSTRTPRGSKFRRA
jgi:hypothetical protein